MNQLKILFGLETAQAHFVRVIQNSCGYIGVGIQDEKYKCANFHFNGMTQDIGEQTPTGVSL